MLESGDAGDAAGRAERFHLHPNEGHMPFHEHTTETLRAAAGRPLERA